MSREPIGEFLADLAETLPRAFQHPEITAVRIKGGTYTVTAGGFEETDHQLSTHTETPNGTPIEIDVVYLEDRPPEDHGPFLEDERTALETLARLLRGYFEQGGVKRTISRVEEEDLESTELLEQYRQLVEEHELILDRMTDVFTALDTNWRITYLNEGSRRAIVSNLEEDYSREELIGRHFWSINPDFTESEIAETKLYKSCHEALERQELVTYENYHEEDDIWVYTRVFPSETGVSILSRDITDRKNKEQKLERQVEQLQEYRHQIERLEEFAGVVSHDLRNPLNVADGHLELARETGDLDHLDEVANSHERMVSLVDDLLSLAREGKELENPDPVDIPELIQTCWSNVETTTATLKVDADLTVLGDRTRLAQLFENLVRNAVEHAGPDVTVYVVPIDGGFAVEDDGPGIPPEDREQVFEAGYSTTEEGTGFGLSIVKDIADAHGWDVTLTESENGGARFEFTGSMDDGTDIASGG